MLLDQYHNEGGEQEYWDCLLEICLSSLMKSDLKSIFHYFSLKLRTETFKSSGYTFTCF